MLRAARRGDVTLLHRALRRRTSQAGNGDDAMARRRAARIAGCSAGRGRRHRRARRLDRRADAVNRWHIAHISTANAVGIVRWATEVHDAERRVTLTCEVTPHHLVFTDEAVEELGPRAKVNPPLRSEDDVDALRDAVRDGTIDAFATDHAPHTEDEKSGDLAACGVGFSGLEIAVGAYAYALPDSAAGALRRDAFHESGAHSRRSGRNARTGFAGGRDDLRRSRMDRGSRRSFIRKANRRRLPE